MGEFPPAGGNFPPATGNFLKRKLPARVDPMGERIFNSKLLRFLQFAPISKPNSEEWSCI